MSHKNVLNQYNQQQQQITTLVDNSFSWTVSQRHYISVFYSSPLTNSEIFKCSYSQQGFYISLKGHDYTDDSFLQFKAYIENGNGSYRSINLQRQFNVIINTSNITVVYTGTSQKTIIEVKTLGETSFKLLALTKPNETKRIG